MQRQPAGTIPYTMLPSVDLPAETGDFVPDDLPDFPHRAMYDLWRARAKGDALPARRDFKPEDMPRLLPHITIFEVVRDTMRFRIRLVGTAIVEAMCIDTTGCWLDELDNTEAIRRRAEAMTYTGTPYFLRVMPVTWSHRTYKRYSTLGLPLADDGRTVDRLLYTMTFT